MFRRRKSKPQSFDHELLAAHTMLERIWWHPEMPNGDAKAAIAAASMATLDVYEQRRRVSA